MASRIVVYLSAVIVAVTCSVASVSTSRSDAELKVITQPGAPASLSKVAIQNDSGREISLMHYQVLNETKRSLKGVLLKVIFFDPFGEPVGGEVFAERMNLKGHCHAEFLTPLKHYAGAGVARVGIAISAVETDKETWKNDSSSKQLLDQMKE
jgi:hypothetical protein